jgi:hypothetical protein
MGKEYILGNGSCRMLDHHGNGMFISMLEEFFATNAHQGNYTDSDVPTGLRHALLRPHGHRIAPANQDIFQVTFVPWPDLRGEGPETHCVEACL